MKYAHLYATPDGESHFEDVEVQLTETGRGTQLAQLIATKGFEFRTNDLTYQLDWHPAPRRQLVINISGEVEITASDGEVRVFGPGSIMLADDTTGKGHLSRAKTPLRESVFIHLAQ
jgi:hypothetical protein